MTELRVDWCSHEAAKWAVEHWHYSGSMPSGKTVKVGAWEGGQFIGAIIFGWGANRHIGSQYGLKQGEICELVRVALKKHLSPVSQIVTMAIKMLRKQSPELKMILSYADPEEGHNGAIYQAMNWVYVGLSMGSEKVLYNGRWAHKRTVDSKYGNHKGFFTRKTQGKYTYLFPLDKAMKKQILPLSQPYPKRDARPADGGNLTTSQAGRFDPDPAALLQK